MCGSDQIATSSVALYATQGGGYATFKNGRYVWHSEIPDFVTDAKVGDPIPDEWDVVAINDTARHEDEQAGLNAYDDFDREEEDEVPSLGAVRSRVLAHFGGNTEQAREALELYPGDFI
jgi:hypothetical protein